MITSEQQQQLKDLLAAAHQVTVVIGAEPTYDQVATGLALSQALVQAGKEVLTVAPRALGESFETLTGLELVRHELGHQNLSISFAYQETAVDKVSYHIDDQNQRFYLVIKPQQGAQPLDANSVEFSYTGAGADLVFLVGIHALESLEQLYFGYEDFYQTTTVVTFHTFDAAIGNIKLNVGEKSSLSEGMWELLQGVELPIDGNMATNLLAGIEEATDGFRSLAVTAETFESVSQLMRMGARRVRRAQKEASPVYGNGMSKGASAVSPKFIQAFSKKAQSAPADAENSDLPTAADGLEGEVSVSKPPKRGKKTPQPGDLDYQPGVFGPGGSG